MASTGRIIIIGYMSRITVFINMAISLMYWNMILIFMLIYAILIYANTGVCSTVPKEAMLIHANIDYRP